MIEINNTTKFAVDKKLFTGLAKKIIKSENRIIDIKDLSIAFVSPDEIRKINKKYLNKNKPTDVLSFEQSAKSFNQAEIIICPDVVRQGEIKKVFIHGVLHILGYDHEKSKSEAIKMQEKENYYISKF